MVCAGDVDEGSWGTHVCCFCGETFAFGEVACPETTLSEPGDFLPAGEADQALFLRGREVRVPAAVAGQSEQRVLPPTTTGLNCEALSLFCGVADVVAY
ncbi:hypothetical protein AQJ64_42000 [Streptomyces griseoruber]|uniref:Uncharacterized protein n=1 Tax=Streptomyces griseoruber TaxID=1943 RepID=A0A101SJU8_9ACTN|nr:hypothetical protein AQJ64_42000 [Streptomyces griseoruber]